MRVIQEEPPPWFANSEGMIALLAALAFGSSSVLFTNAWLIDGTGAPGYRGWLEVREGKIVGVGGGPAPRGPARDLRGLAVAPGFIDSHSHAVVNLDQDPEAAALTTQGLTTVVVGQDGGSNGTYREAMTRIARLRPAVNFAAFSGHNFIRGRVMGKDFERPATPSEIERMSQMVDRDMRDGALGLSTGLEYNPGLFSATEEVIALARVASRYRGVYITHMRSEDRRVMEAVDETIRIAREASLPAQISHIKLGLPSVWGRAAEMLGKMDVARRAGLDITADWYPYPYWQSTITVITNQRDWENVETWREALADVGGADKVLLSGYSPTPAWQGKTIAQIAAATGRDAAEIVAEIVRETRDGKGRQSVIVTAMDEADLRAFLAWPNTSVCSDGGIAWSHPRGAGSFPRVLGRYSREQRIVPLEEAVRKMTSLPARRFGFRDRGLLKVGMVADLVIFDPKTILDRATPAQPQDSSIGVQEVMVAGKTVLRAGRPTGERPGAIITRNGTTFRPLPQGVGHDRRPDAPLCCG